MLNSGEFEKLGSVLGRTIMLHFMED